MDDMMLPARPPRGMTARQVALLKRLYDAHVEQQEALFAPGPAPAPAADAPPLIVATADDARAGASCRVCLASA